MRFYDKLAHAKNSVYQAIRPGYEASTRADYALYENTLKKMTICMNDIIMASFDLA